MRSLRRRFRRAWGLFRIILYTELHSIPLAAVRHDTRSLRTIWTAAYAIPLGWIYFLRERPDREPVLPHVHRPREGPPGTSWECSCGLRLFLSTEGYVPFGDAPIG